MGLADEIEELSKGAPCGIATLIDSTDLTTDELENAFRTVDATTGKKKTSAGIHRALVKRYGDLAPSDQVVRRHRQRICSCVPS